MRACPQCRSLFSGDGEYCTIDGTRLVDDIADPLIGERIDRYQFVERLGTGAMGVVYRVRHTQLDRDFAIKVLYGEFAASESLSARFRREARAMSRMSHPNVVSVVDFGSTEHGLEFLVMEYIDGKTLETVIAEEGHLTPRHAAWIARQIAAGLHEAHRLGFVHRDVKPANVMLSGVRGREHARVLDFGIVGVKDDSISAKLTGTGRIVGTPRYMSPEQARATDVGPPADLYSLGVVLYEMLSGEVPFPGDVLADVLVMHSTVEPAPLPPSEGLEAVVDRLLVKHFEDRVQSGSEVVALLDACFEDLAPSFPSVVEDDIPTERPRPSVRNADLASDLEIPPLADDDEPALSPFPRSDSGLTVPKQPTEAPERRAKPRSVSSSLYDSAPAAFADPSLGEERRPLGVAAERRPLGVAAERQAVSTSGFDAPESDKLSQLEPESPPVPTHEGSEAAVIAAPRLGRRWAFPIALAVVAVLAGVVVLGFPRFAPTKKIAAAPAPVVEAPPPPALPYLIPIGLDHRPDRRGIDRKSKRRRRRVRTTAAAPKPPRLSVPELEFTLGTVLARRGLSLADLEGLPATKGLAKAWRTAREDQTEEEATATLAGLIEATRSVAITRSLVKRKTRRLRRAFDAGRRRLPADTARTIQDRLKAVEGAVRRSKPSALEALAREVADLEKSLAEAESQTLR